MKLLYREIKTHQLLIPSILRRRPNWMARTAQKSVRQPRRHGHPWTTLGPSVDDPGAIRGRPWGHPSTDGPRVVHGWPQGRPRMAPGSSTDGPRVVHGWPQGRGRLWGHPWTTVGPSVDDPDGLQRRILDVFLHCLEHRHLLLQRQRSRARPCPRFATVESPRASAQFALPQSRDRQCRCWEDCWRRCSCGNRRRISNGGCWSHELENERYWHK